MTMTRYLVTCAACAIAFVSCTQNKNLIPDDYAKWERTTDQLLTQQIPGHENAYRKIYINDTGEKMVETVDKNGTGSYNYPEGTIIVKEIYDSSTYSESAKPKMLTCMVKAQTDRQSRGGWLWVIKSLPGGEETIIDYAFCVTCHANANESHPYGDKNPNAEFRDYVFFPYKEKESEGGGSTGGPDEYGGYSY